MMFEKKRPEITKYNEAKVDRMIEQDFQSHRDCPNGRNFLALVMRHHDNLDYLGRFDNTFRGSPSSREWWDGVFCPKCDKRKVYCECKLDSL